MGRGRLRSDGEPTARLPAEGLRRLALGEALTQAERRPGALAQACYGGLWLVTNLVLRTLFRMRVHNPPALSGGFVLVANHVSFFDPFVLSATLRRRVRFVMTELYYRDPRAQWFYRFAHAIPVSARGGNRVALRAARRALEDGSIVGVFPEGGLSRDGRPYLGSPGAVSLVLAAGVPVVPAALIGLDRAMPLGRLPRPAPIAVRFGDPIPAAELEAGGGGRKERLARATRRLMDEISALAGTISRERELELLRQTP